MVVWDGASLAGPRDVLDGAWLALRPVARAVLDRAGAARRQAAADRPAALRRRRRGGARRAREPRAHAVDRVGAATASAPPRCCPARPTDPAEVAELVAFLASRAGDYYSGCALPDGGGMSERWRVHLARHVEPLPGPGTSSWLPVRHELGVGAFGTNAYVAETGRRRRRRAAHRAGHRPRGALLRRPRLGDVHARRRDRRGARRHLRLPPRPVGQAPRGRRRAGHRRSCSFGGWRDRAFAVSGWESRFRATAIREQDPEAARELYEEGARERPGRPVGALRPRLLARALRRPGRGAAAARPRDRARRRRGARAGRGGPRPRSACGANPPPRGPRRSPRSASRAPRRTRPARSRRG